jgi:hypothetical protein
MFGIVHQEKISKIKALFASLVKFNARSAKICVTRFAQTAQIFDTFLAT